HRLPALLREAGPAYRRQSSRLRSGASAARRHHRKRSVPTLHARPPRPRLFRVRWRPESPSISSATTFEFRHCRLTVRADAFSDAYATHRQAQYFGIQPTATIIHIPDVQVEFLFPAQSIAALDLRPPCNAGAHLLS